MPIVAACPVCEDPAQMTDEDGGNRKAVRCDGCGNFTVTGSAELELRVRPERRGVVSHLIRLAHDHGSTLAIDRDLLTQLMNEVRPSVPQQADALLVYLGDALVKCGKPESSIPLTNYREVAAKIGATPGPTNNRTIQTLISGLGAEHLVNPPYIHQYSDQIGLTFQGWRRYEELKRENVESKVAFMAMPFGDPLLDRVFKVYQDAIFSTGFRLSRINDNPPAGLIDNRLRVEIRRARFTVCELTNSNAGAYWEAGFAEGLGRPVIYSCEHAYFEKRKTHFDTNHSHTILWNEFELVDAADRIKATIRATLPTESKMND